MSALRVFKLLVIAGFMTALMTAVFAIVAWNAPVTGMVNGAEVTSKMRFDIFKLEDLRFVLGEIKAGNIKLNRTHEWILVGGLIVSIIGWYLGCMWLLAVDWSSAFGRLMSLPRGIAAIFGGPGRGKGAPSDEPAPEQRKPKKDDDAKRPAARPAPAISHDDMSFIPAQHPAVEDLPDPVPIPDIPVHAPEAAPHTPLSHAPAIQGKSSEPENTAGLDADLPPVEEMLAGKGWINYRRIALGGYENCYAVASADGVALIIDDDKEGEWLADTGELDDPDALWYSETGYRDSPVSFARRAHELLVGHVGPRAVCFVVETAGVITNTDEMAPVWNSVSGQINVCRARGGHGYPDELASLAALLPENHGDESPFEDQIDEIIDSITNDLKE